MNRNTKRKLATIRTIKSITPIKKADFIELVEIDGWQCVAEKGEFKKGDLCVYFEVDSFLPVEERYEFLRKSSYKKMPEDLKGGLSEGFRLKTVKLRGKVSQGLVLPLINFKDHSEIKEIKSEGLITVKGEFFKVGADITSFLGVEKYEPPVPVNLSGQVKGMFPVFAEKTDEERIQNILEYFERYKDTSFECSEKIDGASMTVYWNENDFGVCSRNLDLFESESNTLWKLANELELKRLLDKLGRNIALLGEAAGAGIQKNPLKLKGQKFYLFNIWDIDRRVYLSCKERMKIFDFLKNEVPIEHVPIVESGIKVFTQFSDIHHLLAFAVGNSLLNKNTGREGLVFKSETLVEKRIVSFKVVSNKYLLKHGD